MRHRQLSYPRCDARWGFEYSVFTVGAFPELVEEDRSRIRASIRTIPLKQRSALTPLRSSTEPCASRPRLLPRSRHQGERLVFEVEARRAGSAIDPVLRIVDSSGKQVAHSEDALALGVDARWTSHST